MHFHHILPFLASWYFVASWAINPSGTWPRPVLAPWYSIRLELLCFHFCSEGKNRFISAYLLSYLLCTCVWWHQDLLDPIIIQSCYFGLCCVSHNLLREVWDLYRAQFSKFMSCLAQYVLQLTSNPWFVKAFSAPHVMSIIHFFRTVFSRYFSKNSARMGWIAYIPVPHSDMFGIPSPVVCVDHPNTDSSCSPIAATSSLVLLSRLGSSLNDLNALYLDPIGNPLGRLMSSPQRWLRVCVICFLDAWWGSGRFNVQIGAQEEGGVKSKGKFEFFATVRF